MADMIERPKKIWIWFAGTYLLILGASVIILSAPPDKLPFYVSLIALGIGVISAGKKIYRWIGVLFVTTAILLAVNEIKRGNTLRDKVEKVRNH